MPAVMPAPKPTISTDLGSMKRAVMGRPSPVKRMTSGTLEFCDRIVATLISVLSRISALRRQEPWPGYDELTVAEIEAALGDNDYQRTKDVVAYERAHKNRAGVLRSVQRETANA